MLDTLLFVHLIIAFLLVIVILLQKTSTDGLSGIGSSGNNNMGVMSGRSAANFLTKTTIILAIVFFINAIILANLSTQKHTDFATKLEEIEEKEGEAKTEDGAIPIAK